MAETDACIALAIYFATEEPKKRQKRTRLWMKEWLKKRPKFTHEHLLNELQISSPLDYKNFMRMDHAAFSELLAMVTPLIMRNDTICRTAISPAQRLSSTLRFLASGQTYENLKFMTAISPQSLGRIIIDTCNAICTVLKDNIKLPQTEEEWRKVAAVFDKKWNFPHCLGAIDGKHVEIRKPPHSGSYFFNYKHTFSVVMMAVVNGNYEFIMVDVGANGRVSDGGVFANTTFGKHIKENKLHLPAPQCLGYDNSPLPYVLVADDAFALSENMMKPYAHSQLTKEKRIFNYRLSRARRIVENAFGILASRFQILLHAINLSPKKTSLIVLACCHLHNYLHRKKVQAYLENGFDVDDGSGHIHLANWRSDKQMLGLQPSTSRHASESAKLVRNKLCHYFNNEGAVHWQDKMI